MSQSKIYVGNLPYNATSDDLHQAFAQFGEITEVKLIMDRETGRSKGFAFVSFAEQDAANNALSLNGEDFNGRNLKVSPAKERSDSAGGRGGRGGRGNFGGNGGGRDW